jgi:hypothetical protein
MILSKASSRMLEAVMIGEIGYVLVRYVGRARINFTASLAMPGRRNGVRARYLLMSWPV